MSENAESPSRGPESADPRLAARALAGSVDGVCWLGADGRIVYANEALARLLEYRVEELLTKSIDDIDAGADRSNWFGMGPGPGAADSGAEDAGAAPSARFETDFRSKNGHLVPVEVSACELSRSGEPLVCGFVRDAASRRQVEQALLDAKEAAERVNAAKTRFLAAASHDLRQPLHAMELLVSALAGKSQGAEAQSILSDMEETLAFARRMLDTLLDVSELEAGSITPQVEGLPLTPVLRRVRQHYTAIARDKGLDLRLVPSRLAVRSDAGLLERVFDNLVSNAVRHTNRGRVLIGCRRRGAQVRVEVWDSGPGIAEDAQGKIFDDFCQLDSGAKDRGAGLGLGLGLVRRLSALLGHEIGLRSVPSHGSVFWIDLPTAALAAATPSDAALELKGETGEKILIIEDDEMVLNAMRMVLEGWGYQVSAAASAEAARAVQAVPDLVIADYRLPGGETGDRAILEVRQRVGRDLPGIIVTGEVIPSGWAGLSEQNIHVMKKPVRPAKLRALIRHLYDGRSD